jgi:uncharacterized protein YifE (UPF0438 family)
MRLTGRLMADFRTIANFRKDNSKVIRGVCRQFVVLCQQLGLFGEKLVAIDGGKFNAINNRDHNFTSAKLKRRMEEIESSYKRLWRVWCSYGKKTSSKRVTSLKGAHCAKQNKPTHHSEFAGYSLVCDYFVRLRNMDL